MTKKLFLSFLLSSIIFGATANTTGKITITKSALIGLWIDVTGGQNQKSGFIIERDNLLELFNPQSETEGVSWKAVENILELTKKVNGELVTFTYEIKKFNKYMMEGVLIEGKQKTKVSFLKARQLVSFQETKWILSTIGKEKAHSSSSGYDVFVKFGKDLKINGYGSCNKFYSSYTVDGKKLKIEPVSKTKYDCPLMDNEQSFLTILPEAEKFIIVEQTLYLYRGTYLLCTFEAKL